MALCTMSQAAFVTIGNEGNTADTANGGIYGDVAYTYNISATENDSPIAALFGLPPA